MSTATAKIIAFAIKKAIGKSTKGKFHLVFLSAMYFLFGFLVAIVLLNNNSQPTILAETTRVSNEVGQKAPQFTLTDFNGNQVSLSSFQGKPVVITFWGSWCLSCLKDLIILEKVKQEYQNKVAFIGIHRSDKESNKRAFLLLKKLGTTYPQLLDTTGQTYNQYKFTEDTDINYFLDKNGLVSERLSGLLTEDVVKSKVQQLLEQ